jgi:hypothetical protein
VDSATFERIRPSTAIGEIDADTSKPHSAENTERRHYFGQGSFADNDLFAAAPFDRDGIFIPWCHADALAHKTARDQGLIQAERGVMTRDRDSQRWVRP